jgi:hypothetical protein
LLIDLIGKDTVVVNASGAAPPKAGRFGNTVNVTTSLLIVTVAAIVVVGLTSAASHKASQSDAGLPVLPQS